MNTYQRGLWAEENVIKYFQQNGYRILHKRLKTPFAEIDLFLEQKGCFYMVEVKYIQSWDRLDTRVPKRQKERLLRAYVWFLERRSNPLIFLLAFINKQGKVWICQVDQ